MGTVYRSIRGMHDFLPVEATYSHSIEEYIKNILHHHAYFEIRFPVVEETGLFKKAIGKNTDIINKEMYNFYDKKKKTISLRPEGTVSCIRACIQNNMFYQSQVQKLWYHGPMFRYERPQKGRFRQFYQLGVEYFGCNDIVVDYEIIILTVNILKNLNLLSNVKLEINSIGTLKDRKNFSLVLKKFFQKHIIHLTKHEKNLLSRNPIRILDSKNQNIVKLLKLAPKLNNYLSKSSYTRFEQLCNLLNSSKIDFIINHQLVRGLDYYNDTVFEWKSKDNLGSNHAVCSGGRYDNLIEYLGGKKNSAMGFAIGIERLLIIKKSVDTFYFNYLTIDINVLVVEVAYLMLAINVSEKLRLTWPDLKINTCLQVVKKKNYTKFSKNIKSKFLLVFSSRALNMNKILIKNMFHKETYIPLNRIFQNPCIFKK
ncbi:histidine--tRNA ligase [Buchnera aphidicola]|uniref:Histidine--tRNA ligase n=1 Tax=Buchnera aphidicola (Cinara strobi) TaxID=1921549 RepID=A0A3B1E7U9_9GAMM|nr:histidine--tRNA ligase [Buchnera aphidicola]VAX76527.1 Histidine--tRNA ligase [Buchnera aphidicola (Cinara strobi)]